ncbi:MAG TPA: hypothetical protein VKM94_11040 [Blastocatellia bacterium]|nr:hypothetical protein [Blastocatellia bacterium]
MIDEIAPSDIAHLIGSKSGKYSLNLNALLNVMFSVACDLDLITAEEPSQASGPDEAQADDETRIPAQGTSRDSE